MGKGGRVVGEDIECPFHAFRFNENGECTKTGYDTTPPKNCTVDGLHLRERDGLILAWHDPLGRPPQWELPALAGGDWHQPSFATSKLRSHPQETSENSVDLGHLTIVHGYGEVTETQPVDIEGRRLTTRYEMFRSNPFGIGPKEVKVNFEANVFGLGVSVVQIRVQPFEFKLRLFILSTPTSEGHVTLRAGVSIHEWEHLSWVPSIPLLDPARGLERLVQEIALKGIAHDVSQDHEIWENKVYVKEPRLARGDGPIGRYRLWCRQFYPEALEKALQNTEESAAE
jgi:hypothetical protein